MMAIPNPVLPQYPASAYSLEYLCAPLANIADVEIPYYGYSIGAIGLLIPSGIACEVMPLPTLAPLPYTASWFLGLANQRGNLAPVFDLRRLWFPDDTPQQPQLLLILDKGAAAAGILIDGFPQALRETSLPESPPPIPAILQGHVDSPRLHAGRYYWEFHHARYFQTLRHRVATD